MLYLATLQMQFQSNNQFCQKLLSFLEYIILYLTSQNSHLQILDQACPNTNDPIITITQFVDLLRSDSKVVMQKIQIHLTFYNPT